MAKNTNIDEINQLIELIRGEVEKSKGDREATKNLNALSKSFLELRKMMEDEDKVINKKGNELFESIKDAESKKLEHIQKLRESVEERKKNIGRSKEVMSDDEKKNFENAEKIYDEYTKKIETKVSYIKDLTRKQNDGSITQQEAEDLKKLREQWNELKEERASKTKEAFGGNKSEHEKKYRSLYQLKDEEKALADAYGKISDNIKDANIQQEALNESIREGRKELEKSKEVWKYIKTAGKVVFKLAKDCGKEWMKYDEIAMKQGRSWGFSSDEAARFRRNLMDISHDIADEFGMTNKEVTKIQEDYVKATGRVMGMTREQMTTSAAIGKLVSTETVNEAMKVMDTFGASTDKTAASLYSTHESAAALGLDASKTASAFAKNMSLASKYTFSKGVDGVKQMTLLSERLKFNMDSIARASENFDNISGAIENSAKLQMLGGSYAMNFNNPMEVMYDAMNDMESFTKRITDTWGGKGQFNEKTGMVEISALDKRLIRESAKAMGMDYQEALNIAQRKTIDEKINSELNSSVRNSLTETQKTAIMSRAQWDETSQKHYVTYMDEQGNQQRKYVEDITGKDDISKITQSPAVDDINKNVYDIAGNVRALTEKLTGKARGLISMSESGEGGKTSIGGGEGMAVEKPMGWAKKTMQDVINYDHLDDDKKSLWKGLLHFGYENLAKPSNLGGVMAKGVGLAVLGVMQVKFQAWLKGEFMQIRAAIGGKNSKLGDMLSQGGKGGKGGLWNGIKGVSKFGKVGGAVGAVASIAGVVLSHYGDKRRENGDYGTGQQAMSIGGRALAGAGLLGGFGAMVGGPVGAAIGAGLGALGGGIYGLWEDSSAKKKMTEAKAIGSGTEPTSEAPKTEKTDSKVSKGVDILASIDGSVKSMEKAAIGENMDGAKGKTEFSERQTNKSEVSKTFEKQMSVVKAVNNSMLRDTMISESSVSSATVTPSPITNSPSAVTPVVSHSANGGSMKIDDINLNVNGTIKLDAGGQKLDYNIADALRRDKVLMEKVVGIITDELKKRERYGNA